MPPVFFKDLGKTGKDLLAKKYPVNFELTAESTLQRDVDLVTTQKSRIVRNDDGELSGSFNPKWKFASKGSELSATIYTDKKLEIEATVQDAGTSGLKSKLKVKAADFTKLGSGANAQSVRAELDYKHENAAVTAGFDLINEKHSFTGSAVAQRNNFQGGVQVTYALGSKPDLTSLAVALGYTGLGWQATLSRTAKEGASGKVKYTVNAYQRVDDKLELGAEVNFDASAEKANPSLNIGGQYKLDNSSVKAKCSSGGRMGVSYTQDLNYFSRATVGLDLNTADSKDHKLGLLLEIHD